MDNKKAIIASSVLLVLSGVFLSLAVIYYDFIDKVEKYQYSDSTEYNNVKEALDFVNKLPIQFNITNNYFSGFDNLDENIREVIVMAYAFKNNYQTYPCGLSGTSICIDKTALESQSLLEKFNTKTKFISNSIKLYLDDYGTYTVNTSDSSTYYRINLDNDNKQYRKYSNFSHYKQEEDIYLIYVYEGYYMGNCIEGEKLELFDFMSGKVVYTDTCNNNQTFTTVPDKIKGLQLYKYELKKNENGEFYLYGYNPVNSK